MYMNASSVPACDSSFILTNFSPIFDLIAIASFFCDSCNRVIYHESLNTKFLNRLEWLKTAISNG